MFKLFFCILYIFPLALLYTSRRKKIICVWFCKLRQRGLPLIHYVAGEVSRHQWRCLFRRFEGVLRFVNQKRVFRCSLWFQIGDLGCFGTSCLSVKLLLCVCTQGKTCSLHSVHIFLATNLIPPLTVSFVTPPPPLLPPPLLPVNFSVCDNKAVLLSRADSGYYFVSSVTAIPSVLLPAETSLPDLLHHSLHPCTRSSFFPCFPFY